MNIVAKYIKRAMKEEAKLTQFIADAKNILPLPETISATLPFRFIYDGKSKCQICAFTVKDFIGSKNLKAPILEEFIQKGKMQEILSDELYFLFNDFKNTFEPFTFALDDKNIKESYVGIKIQYRTYPEYFELKYKNGKDFKTHEEAFNEENDPDVAKDIILDAFSKHILWYEPTSKFKSLHKQLKKYISEIWTDKYWDKVAADYFKQKEKDEKRVMKIARKHRKLMGY